MRASIASLAVIRRTEAGTTRYLAQWSDHWNAYAFVGGHIEDSESHRACMVRELAEELRIATDESDPDLEAVARARLDANMASKCWIAPSPLGHLEYDAYSVAANERAHYIIELFEVRLSDAASALVAADEANRWLSEVEIERGKCDQDGKPISDTVRHHVNWLTRNWPSRVPIYWLINAERRLREAMAEKLAASGNDDLPLWDEIAFVTERLRGLFPQAQAIVVRDRFEGFRRKIVPHKLVVEVVTRHEDDEPARDRSPAPGAWNCREVHFVKIGSESERDPIWTNELEEELAGWRRCRPHGSHDSILSSVRGVRDHAGTLLGLIYSDAHSTLGGSGVSSLEEALTACCQHGVPTVASVGAVIRLLYGRLNERLYSRSFVPEAVRHFAVGAAAEQDPVRLARPEKDKLPRTLLRYRIERSLELFCEEESPKADERSSSNLSRDECQRLRREALAWFTQHDPQSFVDPFDLMKAVIDRPNLVPRLLVGAAHGDLHARNVLVSRLEDEVGSVAVFDYGDLDLGNHVGWDFVEMEVEIKIRLYPLLFKGTVRQFVAQVAAFECKLIEWTESIHRDEEPVGLEAALPDPAARRCALIILEFRRAAKRYLGQYRHRANEWLEEYYFLLCCYGTYSSHFTNYNQRELLGAYISAGKAGRRLTWPRDSLPDDIRQASTEAAGLRSLSEPTVARLLERTRVQSTFDAERATIGHHARLAFARVWMQASSQKEPVFFEAALALLDQLNSKFRHVLEIAEWRLLALLELRDEARVEQEIDNLRRRNVDLTYEIVCRHGKLFKKRGEAAWPENAPEMPETARRQFEDSLRIYREAWQIDRHYYPGINVAGLLFLLGKPAESQTLAEQVRQLAATDAGQDHWAIITEADALFLLDQNEKAMTRYREIMPRCNSQEKNIVARQMKLLLRVADEKKRRFWTDERVGEVFV
jgi:8-oxo-dGTP pyrophosphatase MutT (NUDIX family)